MLIAASIGLILIAACEREIARVMSAHDKLGKQIERAEAERLKLERATRQAKMAPAAQESDSLPPR